MPPSYRHIMTSKVKLISQAFLLLGEDAITEADSDLGTSANPKARAASILYPSILNEIMLKTWWGFARKIQQVSRLDETPILKKYQYTYELPFLPNRLFLFGFSPAQENYFIEGNKLYSDYQSDTEPLLIIYITKDIREDDFPAYFELAFVHLLAGRLAMPVTKNIKMSELYLKSAAIKILEATALDAIQEPPPKILRDSLLDAHDEQTW